MACAGVVEHFSGARFSSVGFGWDLGRGSWIKKFFFTINNNENQIRFNDMIN